MSTRRIILMYISEVSGHHSATLAIEATLRKLEPQAEILNINAFNYTNPISESVRSRPTMRSLASLLLVYLLLFLVLEQFRPLM